MKKALLALPILLLAFVPMPARAASDVVSCNDYNGREKTACKNGKEISNAFNANYCKRYASYAVTQVEACEIGQYIGSYNYQNYCSQFGDNYSACVMPTATSAPKLSSDSASANAFGVIAPKGTDAFGGCSCINFDFSENCSLIQKILKAMNFALPLVCVLCGIGVAFGFTMRSRSYEWTQQRQGTRFAWVMLAVLVIYLAIVLALNIVTPGGALFEL